MPTVATSIGFVFIYVLHFITLSHSNILEKKIFDCVEYLIIVSKIIVFINSLVYYFVYR